MKLRIGFILGLLVTIAGSEQSVSAHRLEQFIAPLECVSDTINDGVNVITILTPEECYELLYPTPDPTRTPAPRDPAPVITVFPAPQKVTHDGIQLEPTPVPPFAHDPSLPQNDSPIRDTFDQGQTFPWPLFVTVLLSFCILFYLILFNSRPKDR